MTAVGPLVSVITPAFNAARFVARTIQSVQDQTVANWEMLVVDDCSSDGTAGIVEEAASCDPRIVLIRQATNGGPAKARNAALERARGRFICFLDSDDLWLSTKLERQLTFMSEKDCAVSFTAFRRISEDETTVGRLIEVPSRLDYRGLLRNTAIANLTSMIDTWKTGPIRMVDAGYDDYILWLSLLRRGLVAHGLNEDLARYRVVGGSVSSRPRRSMAWVWQIYRDIEKLSLPHAAWCLVNYGGRAWWKRRRF